MINNTLIAGIACIIIGVMGYMNGMEEAKNKAKADTEAARKEDPKAAEVAPKEVSPTALIPAGIGALLVLCAVVVIFKEPLRKHMMHLAAMLGVIGFLGGFMPIMRAGTFDWNKSSVKNGVYLSVVCLVFVIMCVKSFIDARKARQAGLAA